MPAPATNQGNPVSQAMAVAKALTDYALAVRDGAPHQACGSYLVAPGRYATGHASLSRAIAQTPNRHHAPGAARSQRHRPQTCHHSLLQPRGETLAAIIDTPLCVGGRLRWHSRSRDEVPAGDFLRQPTHTERFPNVPKDVARLKAIWLTAYAWQLENLPDDKAKATREQWLRIGQAIFDGKALEDMGCTPEELVTFDPAWPDDQVDRLLKDAYDMNYRSLVVILEDWLERSAEP